MYLCMMFWQIRCLYRLSFVRAQCIFIWLSKCTKLLYSKFLITIWWWFHKLKLGKILRHSMLLTYFSHCYFIASCYMYIWLTLADDLVFCLSIPFYDLVHFACHHILCVFYVLHLKTLEFVLLLRRGYASSLSSSNRVW